MLTLNHIGIAISDLPRLKELFSILGINCNHVENVPEQGVKTHFFELPQAQCRLELLESIDTNGPVAKFIQKRGPGVHHLAFVTAKGQLGPLCEQLLKAGFKLIYDKPKIGAHEMSVNFIHPSSADGVLIELMEPRR